MRTILLNEKNEFKEKKESKSMGYAIKKFGTFYERARKSDAEVSVKTDVKKKKT